MLENDLKFLEETFKQYYFDHFDLFMFQTDQKKGNMATKNLILE